MPYKNPDAQREYQRRWAKKKRLKFVSSLCCDVCESKEGIRIFSKVPGVRVATMRPWDKKTPRENYKVLCQNHSTLPRKPRKRSPRKKAQRQKKIAPARQMAINALIKLKKRRETEREQEALT